VYLLNDILIWKQNNCYLNIYYCSNITMFCSQLKSLNFQNLALIFFVVEWIIYKLLNIQCKKLWHCNIIITRIKIRHFFEQKVFKELIITILNYKVHDELFRTKANAFLRSACTGPDIAWQQRTRAAPLDYFPGLSINFWVESAFVSQRFAGCADVTNCKQVIVHIFKNMNEN